MSSDTGFDYHPVLLDGFVGKIKTLGLVFDFGFLGNLVCNPFECFFLKDIGFYARLAVTATGKRCSSLIWFECLSIRVCVVVLSLILIHSLFIYRFWN